jgi:hypothetical protein
MQIKSLLVFVLSSVLLCHAGCATLRTKPELLPPLTDPAGYVQTALSRPQPASLAGIARIAIKANNTSQSYKTAYACILPDQLRLEVLGLFNQPGLYVSANRETGITLFVPSQNAWYRGPATAESMQGISGIRMDPFDIVRTIHGQPPGPVPAQAHTTCTQENGSYMCTLTQAKTVQEVWINPQTGSISRSRLFKNGLAIHDIHYQSFRELDGRYIPEKILVAFDRYATHLEIKLQPPLTDPIEPAQIMLPAPDKTLFLPLHTFWNTQ